MAVPRRVVCPTFLVGVGTSLALQIQGVTGSRFLGNKEEYFYQGFVAQEIAHAGIYYDRDTKLIFGEALYQDQNFALQVGHRHRAYETGLLLSQGGFFPFFPSLATERPLGAALSFSWHEISIAQAWYAAAKTNDELYLSTISYRWHPFLVVKNHLRRRKSNNLRIFPEILIAFGQEFHLSFLGLQKELHQLFLEGHVKGGTLKLSYFANHFPDAFQSQIYHTPHGFFLLYHSWHFRHQTVYSHRIFFSQSVFSFSELSFYYRMNKKTSLVGLGYEKPREVGPLLQAYTAIRGRANQVLLGMHIEKYLRFGYVWGYSNELIPVAALFWPLFHDVDNMRTELPLYSKRSLKGLVLSSEFLGFFFYSHYVLTLSEKEKLLFRIGYQHFF
ncbi:MAG: hypothetical protein NZM25_08015 [Leptospiraceae bacterium]|nr:hypothetical protein [Leptospiraceae bacterium]MDW8305546.1 hypothetical protein [Leptospiraceae bacterium]